jgi:hypothetical protein
MPHHNIPNIRCCNTCEQTKGIELFRNTSSGNKRHICADCEKIRNRERNARFYQKNKDKCLAKAKVKYNKKRVAILAQRLDGIPAQGVEGVEQAVDDLIAQGVGGVMVVDPMPHPDQIDQ